MEGHQASDVVVLIKDKFPPGQGFTLFPLWWLEGWLQFYTQGLHQWACINKCGRTRVASNHCPTKQVLLATMYMRFEINHVTKTKYTYQKYAEENTFPSLYYYLLLSTWLCMSKLPKINKWLMLSFKSHFNDDSHLLKLTVPGVMVCECTAAGFFCIKRPVCFVLAL